MNTSLKFATSQFSWVVCSQIQIRFTCSTKNIAANSYFKAAEEGGAVLA